MTTLISTQPAAGSAVTFSGIPNSYQDLILNIDGASHNNGGNAYMRLELSPDGSNWSPPMNIGYSAASAAISQRIVFADYRETLGAAIKAQPGSASPSLNGTASFLSWNVTGGIAAMRLSMSAGNFDAGSFSLSGR